MAAPLSDEALMLAFKAGNAAAFEELVHRHRTAVFSYLARLLRNRQRAEDLLQETWLRVVRAASTYEPSARFTTWLFLIARNLWRDAHSRSKWENVQSLSAGGEELEQGFEQALHSTSPQPDRVALNNEVRPHLELALEKTSIEQREVFLLHEVHGMTFQEIADITGVPLNTAKSRYRYAVVSLRRSLAMLRDIAVGPARCGEGKTTG